MCYAPGIKRIVSICSSIVRIAIRPGHFLYLDYISTPPPSPPRGFEDVLRWLVAPSRDSNVTMMVRLIFQSVVYLVWKEINKRIHSAVEKPPCTLIGEIQQTVRLRLDPLTRKQIIPPGQNSLLATWFLFFDF